MKNTSKGNNFSKEAGCPSCHNLETKKVGPPLRGILQRRDSIWVKKAILNMDKLLAQKDSQAIHISNEYGNMAMPQHEFLSENDLQKIIFYLDKGRDY